MLDSRNGKLLKNTAYLYALTFSSQIINICTIPYQTRILSPELYGVVGYAISIMNILSLVMNFGFLYSATQQVAENAEDETYLSKLYSAVLGAKVLLGAALLLILLMATALIPFLREHAALIILYFIGYFLAALLPDFLYRGLERMKAITVRTVLVRLAAAAMIFIFLKSESDVLVLPISMILGNVVAFVACCRYDSLVLGISPCKVSKSLIGTTLKDGFPFFVSRAASTVYQSANALVLGSIYPGSAVVGWFNASDKVLSVVKQVSSPVADSFYPYMVKNKNYKLAVRILALTAPIILVCCVALFIFADEFCLLVFGNQYSEAGDVIRCLIPAMAVIFPTYIICFPILVPMGLSNYANVSTIIGMTVQLALLGILLVSGYFNVYTLCLSASASEVTVFLFRLIVMIAHRKRMCTQ